jgi:bifunctional UDP-N-acetylglucosamine pyrophosphorylase/glucosamine-1-phosphate N-acetyltransferase
MNLAVIVLAAGMGKRMKSKVPKVLHPILGRPMLSYVMTAVGSLSPKNMVVVIGHGGGDVQDSLKAKGISFVDQKDQLGTGHAARCAKKALSGFKGPVLILNGDYPLITTGTLKTFISKHGESEAALSILTTHLDEPRGYGRIVRNGNGSVERIVEESDASADEKRITEVNSGTFCVDSTFLWKALEGLGPHNKQKEYYLTDIVEAASKKSLKISGVVVKDSSEVLGVNDRKELSDVERLLRIRTNESLMRSGVTIIDPDTTYISPEVKIGRDSVIYPNTYIYGASRIGVSSTIGPNVWIEDSELGKNVTVKLSSYINNAIINNNVNVGPFAHLRPEARISDDAKIGNFVEIKKSNIGKGSKVPHLSYVGDAVIGKNVNIGAGTITCNYDGFNKHETRVSDDVFIGSDTMLVAPVKVGKGAVTGAGSTITKDVPGGALAIGRAKQTIIEKWSRKPREKKRKG